MAKFSKVSKKYLSGACTTRHFLQVWLFTAPGKLAPHPEDLVAVNVPAQGGVYNVQFTVHSVHSGVYSVKCTVHSVQCTVYSVQCTVYSVQCTVYSVHCTECTIHCKLFTVHSILH